MIYPRGGREIDNRKTIVSEKRKIRKSAVWKPWDIDTNPVF